MEDLVYGPFLSRKQAQEKGLKQYFPGTTSKQGHVAPRVTSGGQCMVCKNIAQAKKRSEGYFREYRAKRRETDPNWKANKARVARESYQRHKDDEGAKEKRQTNYEKNQEHRLVQERIQSSEGKVCCQRQKG